MSLCAPEDKPAVVAIAAEFMKLSTRLDLKEENVLEAVIAVAAAMIEEKASGDPKIALDLFGRFQRSLLSAIEFGHETGER